METLTSTWIIPASAIKLGADGPKASYSMTQNRGIVLRKGVQEGTWRMKWALSGITDITTDHADIRDNDNWPIREKTYATSTSPYGFTINVNDFDSAYDTDEPLFSFSEVGANNKAEIIFFPNGTTTARVVDPTTVVSSVTNQNSKTARHVFYNGSYFFLLYTTAAADTGIYYQWSADNVSWTAAGDIVSADLTNDSTDTSSHFDIYVIDDNKFDLGYISKDGSGSPQIATVRTCTISGTSISCGAALDSTDEGSSIGRAKVVRTPSSDRIFLFFQRDGGAMEYEAATSGGDAENVSFGTNVNFAENDEHIADIVPFYDSDQVMVLYNEDKGSTATDELQAAICTTTGCTPTELVASDAGNEEYLGGIIRKSDSDFRAIFTDSNNTTETTNDYLNERRYTGSWSDLGDIDTGETDQDQANPFYDQVSGDMYVVARDTAGTDSIERFRKISGNSTWETEVVADDTEAGSRSRPMIQLSAAASSTATTTRDVNYLTWGYYVAASAFDIKVGSLVLEDISFATSSAAFEIYESSTESWDGAGTLKCSASLTDADGDTISCDSGSLSASTEYRVQVELINKGTSTLHMTSPKDSYLDHKSVIGGWGGTSPTIGNCGFNDSLANDGSTTCNAAQNGNDVRITNTGAGHLNIGDTTTNEAQGFWYMITTDSDAATDSNSYFDAAIGTSTIPAIQITEVSSKITVNVAGIAVSGNAYEDDSGTTALEVCDGATSNLRLIVATSTQSQHDATCDNATGAFSFDTGTTTITTGTPLIVFINDSASTYGASIHRFGGTVSNNDVTNLNIRASTTIITHDSLAPVFTYHLDLYDNDQDTDLPYRVSSAGLTIEQDVKWIIGTSSAHYFAASSTASTTPGGTFARGGDVEIRGGAKLAMGNSDLFVGGDYQNNGRFAQTSYATTTFYAPSGTQTLAGSMTATSSFGNLVFTDAAARTFSADASTTNLIIESGSGTITAPASGLLTIGGNFSNDATFTHNNATTTFYGGQARTIAGTLTDTSQLGNIVFDTSYNAADWYHPDWLYRKKIVLDSARIATTTDDFPVLISLYDTDIAVNAQADYDDILFTSSNGTTKLNHEIEATSTPGEVIAWVRSSVSSSADTELYMYYGNAATSSEATTTGVWDFDNDGDGTSDYVGVWHLGHDGTATTSYPDFRDSTKNANDGSSQNMNSSDLVTGKADGGLDFDGGG